MKLETENVYLREVTLQDANDIYEYAKDPETGPKAGWPPHKTIQDTENIIKHWLGKECTEIVYAIVYKPNNKVVGTIGVAPLNTKQKDEKNLAVQNLLKEGKKLYEIGCTIGKEYWNKGIATKTLKLMIDFLFKKHGADIIIVTHYAENTPSKIVQEKNGLKQIYAYERDKAWWTTDCKTMIVRAKTKEEWLNENTKEK